MSETYRPFDHLMGNHSIHNRLLDEHRESINSVEASFQELLSYIAMFEVERQALRSVLEEFLDDPEPDVECHFCDRIDPEHGNDCPRKKGRYLIEHYKDVK